MSRERAAVVALLLAQHGTRLGAQRVLELAGEVLDRRAIARLLRQQGIPVHCVVASEQLLRGLASPTLLELQDGELLIFEGTHDAAVFVRGADDQPRRAALGELAARVGCVFERQPGDTARARFGPGIVARLSEQSSELWRMGLTVAALAGLGPLFSWLTREAVAGALDDRSPSLLWTLVTALVFAAALRSWLGWLRARAFIAAEARVVRGTNPSLFRRLLALPYARSLRLGFATQWAALSSAELAARGTTTLVAAPVVEGLAMSSFLLALLKAAPRLGCLIGGGALLTLSVAYALARWRSLADVAALREAAGARERLHDLVQGIATIKAEHGERPVLLRWLEALLRERGACLTRDLRESWLLLWLSCSEQTLRMSAVCYGALEVLDGKSTLPEFIYIVLLSEGFLGSLTAGCRLLSLALAVRAHGERVDQLLDDAELEPKADALGPLPRVGEPVVQMSDVWFRHAPDQPWVLRGYDLTVQAGEHLTLRGVSGTGKTTILRLLAGLYRPERGTVSVYGRDPARDRREVRYLPQQAQLFAGSLRDNLEQLSGATLACVVQAAERTGLTSWLATLPMGIETVVAGQGANLSGGQRQWLLLTAAVASERPVILLDESLSQVDHLLRARLDIRKLFAGKTTISVAHD